MELNESLILCYPDTSAITVHDKVVIDFQPEILQHVFYSDPVDKTVILVEAHLSDGMVKCDIKSSALFQVLIQTDDFLLAEWFFRSNEANNFILVQIGKLVDVQRFYVGTMR